MCCWGGQNSEAEWGALEISDSVEVKLIFRRTPLVLLIGIHVQIPADLIEETILNMDSDS